MRGCAPHAKKMLASFVQFCKFQLGKKYAFLLPIGGKICIFPPFQIPFNHFHPPTCYLAIFFCLLPQHVTWPYFSVCPPPSPPVKQKIYTPGQNPPDHKNPKSHYKAQNSSAPNSDVQNKRRFCILLIFLGIIWLCI